MGLGKTVTTLALLEYTSSSVSLRSLAEHVASSLPDELQREELQNQLLELARARARPNSSTARPLHTPLTYTVSTTSSAEMMRGVYPRPTTSSSSSSSLAETKKRKPRRRKNDVSIQLSCATLIVVPPMVFPQWKAEIERRLPQMQLLTHNARPQYQAAGSPLEPTPEQWLHSNTIVLTSFESLCYEDALEGDVVISVQDDGSSTVVSDSRTRNGKRGGKGKPRAADKEPIADLRNNVLLRVHWHRIVLDDAHLLSSRYLPALKQCLELRANIRWCLTSTPSTSYAT